LAVDGRMITVVRAICRYGYVRAAPYRRSALLIRNAESRVELNLIEFIYIP
jgi:hypothetical protein